MNRSIAILSLVLFTLMTGPAWAGDGIYLSSDNNINYGSQVSAALDCGMPALASDAQAKYDKMSKSAKARYNARWQKKLKGLVYKSYDHQYTRSQVNDMSEAELASILRANPHMVGTMQNRPGRCASRSRTASKPKPKPVEPTPAVVQAYPSPDVLWTYAAALNNYDVELAAYENKQKAKAELAAAEQEKKEAAKRLELAKEAVSESADDGRHGELVKAQEADQKAAERLRRAKKALDEGVEV